MHPLAQLDHLYVWHPFTQMQEWLEQEPIVIVKGKGQYIQDAYGKWYLDANSSIWTNLHGHQHPLINKAIIDQLKKIAHSSALGLANEPASIFAAQLIEIVNPKFLFANTELANPSLKKVFFSDDGSTAIEVAIKLAFEFAKRTYSGIKPRFLSLDNAYHGDTIGAVSLGHIDLFHATFRQLLFRSDKLKAPYCYRCRFNRATPEREDARIWRKCSMQCIDIAERVFQKASNQGKPYTAFVFEPLMQGAAGMIAHPKGWLYNVAQIARHYHALLIADEVMTGFGRAVDITENDVSSNKLVLFASHQENVQPDLMALAKGITGGYLPLAVTLTTESIFKAFLGKYEEFKTFYHGHSYTANQLGCAAAITSLNLLKESSTFKNRLELQNAMRNSLKKLWELPIVGDIRQCGTVAGIELVQDWRLRKPFDIKKRVGFHVCKIMTKYGVITRPLGDVVVFMPPYCTRADDVERFVDAFIKATQQLF